MESSAVKKSTTHLTKLLNICLNPLLIKHEGNLTSTDGQLGTIGELLQMSLENRLN